MGIGLSTALSGGVVLGPFVGLVGGGLTSLGQHAPAQRRSWYAPAAGLLGGGLAILLWWLLQANNPVLATLYAFSVIPLGLMIAALVQRGEVRPPDALRWSWQSLQTRWYLVLGLALLSGLLSGLFNGLGLGLGATLGGGLLGVLVGGLTSAKVQAGTQPNGGTWRSLRRAIATWLVGGLGFALVGGLVGVFIGGLIGRLNEGLSSDWMFDFTFLDEGLVDGLLGGLLGGIIFGPAVSLYAGGLAFVQHWVLRLIFTLSGAAPWRYVHFLDHATERILLRRVGSSYTFVHPMLLAYLAKEDVTDGAS
ncbi:MAG: hypothetical protein HC837_14755 [Chloroflexaceae bacterium]|nr:hypothetical protein [Chloroflexaceae bacterium]